ncbi:hypothetical protein Dimus_014796 [Dionaea muscipula]
MFSSWCGQFGDQKFVSSNNYYVLEAVLIAKMKLEEEYVFSHPSPPPPRKSYNPFDSDDDLLDGRASKGENRLAKENSVSVGFGTVGAGAFDQSVSTTLPFHMNNGDFQWEEAILVHPTTVVEDSAIIKVHDKGLFGKGGMDFYTDNVVMDCEMPEFIVCYKESSYQSVKDICIDEGVPSQGKSKTWKEVGKEENPSVLLDNNNNNNGDDVDTGKENRKFPILGGLKSSTDTDSRIDFARVSEKMYGEDSHNQCPPVDDSPNARVAIHEGGGETETDGQLVHEAAESNSLTGGNVPAEKKDGFNSSDYSSGLISRERLKDGPPVNEGHETGEKLFAAAAADTLEIQTSSNNLESSFVKPPVLESPSGDARLAPSSSDSQDSADNSTTSNVSYLGRDMDSGTVTIVVNPFHGTEDQGRLSTPAADEKFPPKTQSMTRYGEGTSGNGSTAYLTLEQHFLGETSFSAGIPPPPPSSITYTGPIGGYSGNISLRSESSAGSTRSFAFPVLQTEWNDSPVRMGKADQKRSQKHRGWLQAIICCRF